MPQMIRVGKKLIRISPRDPIKLEYSLNEGRIWQSLCHGAAYGKFVDLFFEGGNEILAQTEKGLYFSRNEGRVWSRRS